MYRHHLPTNMCHSYPHPILLEMNTFHVTLMHRRCNKVPSSRFAPPPTRPAQFQEILLYSHKSSLREYHAYRSYSHNNRVYDK